MPRHLRSKADSANARMDAMLGPAPKKRSSCTLRTKHIAEVRERMLRKEWNGRTPGKMVAMYWLCHEKVYGVPPLELNKTTAWQTAMKMAGGMVKRHFDDDMERAITFMRWVWTSEAEREKRRRENKRDGQRLNWKNQFSQDYLITDWRAAAMRT